eukprot:1561321-Pleurochrysis_carterae.AAC.1
MHVSSSGHQKVTRPASHHTCYQWRFSAFCTRENAKFIYDKVHQGPRTKPIAAVPHSQKSAEVPVIARKTGQVIYKCPATVPARAATSHMERTKIVASLKMAFKMAYWKASLANH